MSAFVIVVEELMPRFYFHLTSKDSHIPDDCGKELDTLNDAYEHAWMLIYKILFHVGHDDAKAWKVVISNEEHELSCHPDVRLAVIRTPHTKYRRPCFPTRCAVPIHHAGPRARPFPRTQFRAA